MDKFGCSKYLVEKARQLKAENSLWKKSKDSQPSYRMRLDMNKVEHFFLTFYSKIDILRIPTLLHHRSNFKVVPCLKFLKLS